MEKLHSSKNMFENGWWENRIPRGSAHARTDNNVFYHYCHSLHQPADLASV